MKHKLHVTITGTYTVDLAEYTDGTYGKNPTAASIAKMDQRALRLIDMPHILDKHTLVIQPMNRGGPDTPTDPVRLAASELLAALVVHATPAPGSPVDLAAKKLNNLVK